MSSNKPLNSTVQLCELNEQNFPVSFASGCLIRVGAKKLLLSVEHATGNLGRWAMQIEYNRELGAANYVVGTMNFILRKNIPNGEDKTVDFSYVEVPDDVIPTRHIVTEGGDTISQEDIRVFDGPFNIMPSTDDCYSFEGAVMPATYENPENSERPVFETKLMTYGDLKFLRRDGEFFVFMLPFQHPGHEWFGGCSGAPILNSQGFPVGLISSGNTSTNEIFATALDLLLPILEVAAS